MLASRTAARGAPLAALLLLAAAAQAQEAARDTPEDRWVVSVIAYAWAPSVDGHASVGGQKADVDMPFSDMLEDLTLGAMGAVSARRGRFGFYVNPFFARTRSDESSGDFETRVRSDSSMVGVGGLYRLLDWEAEPAAAGPRGGQLEALAGARVTYMRTEINGRHGLPKLDDSHTWVDPIVGLGGRLDATNVVPRPLATVITPVSVDHTKFLGETVGEIAIEKAGILKKGVPAIIAHQQDSVRDVIEACAARVGAGRVAVPHVDDVQHRGGHHLGGRRDVARRRAAA